MSHCALSTDSVPKSKRLQFSDTRPLGEFALTTEVAVLSVLGFHVVSFIHRMGFMRSLFRLGKAESIVMD